MGLYKYFTDDEVKGLDPNFVKMLDWARGNAGIPFILTSTVRSPIDNTVCGGANDSTHCKGIAVDIGLGHLQEGFARDNARCLIMDSLRACGFKRRGTYAAHIHVDLGHAPEYVQDVEWLSATS